MCDACPAFAAFALQVTEMSGRSHVIDGVLPATTIADLLQKVWDILGQKQVGDIGLVFGTELFTSNHGRHTLSELGVVADSMLTAVQMHGGGFFEFSGAVGDEDQMAGHSESESIVRICLVDTWHCILVRRTHIRALDPGTGMFQARLTWDLCRGTYASLGGGKTEFSWEHKYRRVRNAVTETDALGRLTDSGWIAKDVIPEAWKQVQLEGETWRRGWDKFTDGHCILGIRLTGQGSVAEALTILALS